ncbi:MAG TPA: helix-turn-helix domain-containing protein [Chryseolinea sp.]|nr:helix-turn-helix domain-containing protein [Chryseolinea sp.]
MASNIDKWLKVGYELLAAEEIDGINIERLARTLDANKSGFYHYFGTKDEYFKQLIGYHIRRAGVVASEIQRCNAIDPDLLHVVVREKLFFLVESQLFIKGKPLKNKVDATVAGRLVTDEVVALWCRQNETPSSYRVLPGTVNIIRHFFYGRIDAHNVSHKFLHVLVGEIRAMLNSNMFISRYDDSGR